MRRLFLVVHLILLGFASYAAAIDEEVVAALPEPSIFDNFVNMDLGTMLWLSIVGVLFLIFLVVAIGVFGRIAVDLKKRWDEGEVKDLPWFIQMWGIFKGDITSLSGVNQDVVLHEYDGIEEYDNDMPPWWKSLFYICIMAAGIYMFVYHFSSIGKSSEEEYQASIELAEVMYANIDIDYKAPVVDEKLLVEAKESFEMMCSACHGKNGEGIVGPNLTDAYWIHGGDVNDIYKTIKYGAVENGMRAWKNDYSNQQIYELSSYILSLQGSEPANAKEPQGELAAK